jgi:Trk K+ transport system NAD-binding subunit
MKFLIVGLGSIGERHLKNLFKIGQRDVIGVEINKKRK